MNKWLLLVVLLLPMSAGAQLQMQQLVGPQAAADGTPTRLRADKTSAQVVTDAHGRFQEAVLRGNVFTLSSKTQTVIAVNDVAPLPANGSPHVGVYNPIGSGKNLVILKVGCDTVSGTPGGPMYLDISNNTAAPETLVTSTPAVNNLTFLPQGSVARTLAHPSPPSGIALTTTLRPLCGQAAIAAGAGNYSCEDITDGSIIVVPGNFIGVSAHATGTSHVLSCYMIWEEVLQ